MRKTDLNYTIKRSSRKTLAIQITASGVVVRAPYRVSGAQIRAFVESHRSWIEKHLKKTKERIKEQEEIIPLSDDELRELKSMALKEIPEKVRHYAPLVGVKYNRITIRQQRTRWGSCSAKGNLNFNCLLMLTPPGVIDAVIVHELCHLNEMNHSKRFYDEVIRVYPDYKKWNGWLKENGSRILARIPAN